LTELADAHERLVGHAQDGSPAFTCAQLVFGIQKLIGVSLIPDRRARPSHFHEPSFWMTVALG